MPTLDVIAHAVARLVATAIAAATAIRSAVDPVHPVGLRCRLHPADLLHPRRCRVVDQRPCLIHRGRGFDCDCGYVMSWFPALIPGVASALPQSPDRPAFAGRLLPVRCARRHQNGFGCGCDFDFGCQTADHPSCPRCRPLRGCARRCAGHCHRCCPCPFHRWLDFDFRIRFHPGSGSCCRRPMRELAPAALACRQRPSSLNQVNPCRMTSRVSRSVSRLRASTRPTASRARQVRLHPRALVQRRFRRCLMCQA